jgi:hypothetical protein
MMREIIVPEGIFPRLVLLCFVILSGMMPLLRTGGIRACGKLG